MKKMQKIGVALVGILLVFSGCSFGSAPEPSKPASEVIQESIANLAGVTAAEYEVALKGTMKDAEGKNTDMDVSVSGVANGKNAENPAFSIMASLDLTNETTVGSGKAEVKISEGKMYAMISDVEGEMDGAKVDMTPMEEYMNKWWIIPSDVVSVKDLPIPSLSSLGEESADESGLLQGLKDATFFKDLEYSGSEKAGGVECYKYKANLDKEAFLEFAQETSASMGSLISDVDLEEAKANLEKVNFTGEIWVGVEDMTMRKLAVNIDSNTDQGTGMIDLSVELSALNEDLTVSAPSDAEELNPMMLLPLMMMGSGFSDTGIQDGNTEIPGLDDASLGDLEFDPSIEVVE